MAFRLEPKNIHSSPDPETLFRDLRSRTVEGLLAQQADTLRSYMTHEGESDLALELPTGSGKTLVGLLIAEWQRRNYGRRCVFLCPTRQLVHQVAEQALEKYGIPVITFAGSKKEFSPKDVTSFETGEAIAISTYSSLFNYSPFFTDVDTLIFDDAHSAENYVATCWSVEISRFENEPIFQALRQLIDPLLPAHERARFDIDEGNPLDNQWVNKIPFAKLLPHFEDLICLMDIYCTDGELFFRWQMLRGNLQACNVYYTSSRFLIRPILPPTNSFLPFSKPIQRIYMSATLGEGGDLERIFGREKITRIPAPPGWNKQGIGRRFFVFPLRVVDTEDANRVAVQWVNKFPRALILTPSTTELGAFTALIGETQLAHNGYTIVQKSELENSKKSFTSKNKAIAMLANRYDGIDLIGDECRYLIVSGLPESTNLQERFLISRMTASKLFDVRLRTRITQAVGRCTRSATDWSLVVILGDKMQRYLSRTEQRCYLHPELQAEVEFGLNQSKVDNLDKLAALVDIFVAQGLDWKAADDFILKNRDGLEQAKDSSMAALDSSVVHEVRYLNFLWNCEYPKAVSAARDVLAALSGDALRGYRAWWYYLGGNAAHLAALGGLPAFQSVAAELFANASAAAQTLPWLNQLRIVPQKDGRIADQDPDLSKMIERLELQFEKFGSNNSAKIEKASASIRNGLRAHDSDSFEAAQVQLGDLLGFHAENSNEDGAPDPWWVLGTDIGIVFEDYTETGTNPQLSKKKVQQGKGHKDWLKYDYHDVEFSVIFCANLKSINGSSERFLDGMFYCSIEDFIAFSERCLAMVRSLWDSFPGVGDMLWRDEAITTIRQHQLTPKDILQLLTTTRLQDAFKQI